MSKISYDYYRVFYYVAKYKSFTAAARVLMNNQPNITRMMKKLEDSLGCTLFIRQRHGITLTIEGEKLYHHIAIAFEHIENGEREISKAKGLESGTVTLAVSEIALHCFLLPVLKQFRQLYPKIKIRLLNHTTPQALDVLDKGLADLAVVTEPFVRGYDYTSVVLKQIQEVAICSDTLIINENKNNLLTEIPIIGLGEKTGSFSFYSDYFSKLTLTYSPEVEAATSDQIIPMVKSDLGIGFVPKEFLENINLEHIKVLNLKPSIPSRNICLVKKKELSLSLASIELEKMIKKNTLI